MSPLRLTLVALLVASTALFAVGAIAERAQGQGHNEPASARAQESGESAEMAEGEHDEGGASEATHTDESEELFGVDTESTPLIVLALLVGLALAALAAARGSTTVVLVAIALIALAWAALDVREVVHQRDESNTGIAIVAIAVAVLHLGAATTAGLLAARARHPDVGRAGTMPA
jgi:Flp pilus assembly protein TadB